MQKSEKKLNVNPVGATSSRPYFEEITKKQKGITLISLIITIIVMLILVGLTISVALNGGIFSTADEATIKKEKAVIYEQIVGAMQLANNGKIVVNETYRKVAEMYGAENIKAVYPETVDENTTEVTFTVKGKKGTYKYKITERRIIQDPPAEDPIITTLNKFKTQSAIELLDLGSFDAEKGYYKINTSKHPELENLEDSEVYIIGRGAGAIVRDPNTNKDYIFKIDDDGNVKETILQPEEKITTVKEGVVALSNLEEFNTGANFFIGFEPTGEVIDGTRMTEFENSEINSIILSNVDYFNSLDDSMSIDGLVVDYLYVPVGFEQTIWADRPVNREFTFGGRDADDVDSLNKVTIDGQEYYELHWSELED